MLEGINLDSAQIDLEISPDGRVKVEVSGVPGTDCLRVKELILGLLGGQVISEELTEEYYQKVSLVQRLKSVLRK